jgi:hypothetical protein
MYFENLYPLEPFQYSSWQDRFRFLKQKIAVASDGPTVERDHQLFFFLPKYPDAFSVITETKIATL